MGAYWRSALLPCSNGAQVENLKGNAVNTKRTSKTAEEIRHIVWERIHATRQVQADGASIRVPLPTRSAVDLDGSNWDMQFLCGEHQGEIRYLLNRARSEFLLAGLK